MMHTGSSSRRRRARTSSSSTRQLFDARRSSTAKKWSTQQKKMIRDLREKKEMFCILFDEYTIIANKKFLGVVLLNNTVEWTLMSGVVKLNWDAANERRFVSALQRFFIWADSKIQLNGLFFENFFTCESIGCDSWKYTKKNQSNWLGLLRFWKRPIELQNLKRWKYYNVCEWKSLKLFTREFL